MVIIAMLGVSSLHLRVVGLSCFIGLLSFKPSEPYLSQYLICNAKTFEQTCGSLNDEAECVSARLGAMREDGYGAGSCTWSLNVGQSTQSCSPRACSSYPIDGSGGATRCADVNYCTPDKPSNTCVEELCYKSFSEIEVNNYIYPWSTYAYLPALLFLCPMAELVSYRVAILIGIAGRVVTRFLLLFGTSLPAMQLMQVTYSIGTAAEDIFYAYVFYVFPTHMFQVALSTCRSSALISCLVASILGDLLVTQGDVPLTVLQIISCVAVCCGAFLGFFVILPSEKTRQFVECGGVPLAAAGSGGLKGGGGAIDVAIGNFMLTTTSPAFPSSSNPSFDDDTSKLEKTQTLVPDADVGRPATPGVPTRSEIWYQKSMIFASQWSFFRSTLQRDPNLFNQVLYWIVANATFTEIFGYEVAVYQQLNGGSNRWNGSVLSVMLLLGAVGAMLPVYLKVDAPGTFSMHSINAVISIAGVLGSVFLLVFAYVWKAIASLAMLSLFVACWQFISVIILVQVATELKRHHELTHGVGVRDIEVASYTAQGDDTGEDRDRDSLSKGVDSSSSVPLPQQAGEGAEPPSYAIALVSLVGVSVVLQNLTVTIVFSGLQLGLQQALLVPCYLFAIATFLFVCASLGRWFRESPTRSDA